MNLKLIKFIAKFTNFVFKLQLIKLKIITNTVFTKTMYFINFIVLVVIKNVPNTFLSYIRKFKNVFNNNHQY